MKSLTQFISESPRLEERHGSVGIEHGALLNKVSDLFDAHKNGNKDFETVRLEKNVHTGATKHQIGSVKAHSLAYRPKEGGNAYTGKEKWDPNKKYAKHPLKNTFDVLIDRYGGTRHGPGEGFIDTVDGIRHHFTTNAGTNFHRIEHRFNKKGE